MILEQVMPHPTRTEIYINEVITPHDKVKTTDKIIINRILLKEVVRKGKVSLK